MFEIRHVDLGQNPPMTSIDGIPCPCEVIDYVQDLANKAHKLHYVGIVEKINPNYKEEPLANAPTFTGIIRDIANPTVANMRKHVMTGDFIVSDDRDEVLAHGCGRLIWVTSRPGRDNTVHDYLTNLHDVLSVDASGRTAHKLMFDCASAMIRASRKHNFFGTVQGKELEALGDALALKGREIERALERIR